MLAPFSQSLGVEEVSCPACRATGWLDRRLLEDCPICCGFQDVPRPVSLWFRTKEAHRESLFRLGPEAKRRLHREAGARVTLPGGSRRLQCAPRHGRTAEVAFKVPVEAMH